MSLHPRPKESVVLELPKDALESLKKVAASRDMSLEALLRLYIGHGLRQDMAKLFADRVLETTAQFQTPNKQQDRTQATERHH